MRLEKDSQEITKTLVSLVPPLIGEFHNLYSVTFLALVEPPKAPAKAPVEASPVGAMGDVGREARSFFSICRS